MTVPIGIIGIISAALGIIGTLVKWATRPKPRQSPKDKAEKEAHKARTASAKGDAADVNARMERYRLRKRLALVCSLGLLLCGCASSDPPPAIAPTRPPDVVVISAERYQYPMTNSAGIVGWFVPLAVHADYVEAVELVEYYRSQLQQKRKVKP